MNTNDKIERSYFERFRTQYPLPNGRIVYRDKPDVIVRGTRTIGIEITNFFVRSGNFPSSEQRQRPRREAVVAEAQRLYLEGGGRKIELTFDFDVANPISATRKKELPARLAALVHSLGNQTTGDIHRHLFRETIPEVASVYLNAKEYSDAKWQVGQVHAVELASKDELVAIVREKEF